MYRIRFHGRGGQGMKTAAQILGRAFFLEGFEVQDAPRYGAERRGAPIFAYVRADRRPIHERGVITSPDLIVVADETLVPMPAAGVLQDVTADTAMLINSPESTATWRARLRWRGFIVTLPAVADITAATPPIGAICAGAAARLVGMIGRSTLETALRDELAGHAGFDIEKSASEALAAFDALAGQAERVREGSHFAVAGCLKPDWIELSAEPARNATPDIHAAATSEKMLTGAWRTLRPTIDYEHCNRCAWVCSTLCPDGAIQVDPDHTPRIDYDHCKGCLVCVAVCPPHAIRAIPERAVKEVAP